METPFLAEIILEMREYQRVNNIKEKCITNTQYLHTTMKKLGVANSFKAEAVITASYDKDNNVTKLFAGHIVLTLDNTVMIDPSYEIFSLKDKKYFYTIKEFIDYVNLYTEEDRSHFNIKKIIKHYMRFRFYADEINRGNFVSDKQYYEELDYYLGI
jgi:hypothetical protein